MPEIIAEVLGWVLGLVGTAAGGGLIYVLRRVDTLRDEIRDHRIMVAEQYVHRGDWIREQTALEARLDKIAQKIDDVRDRMKP